MTYSRHRRAGPMPSFELGEHLRNLVVVGVLAIPGLFLVPALFWAIGTAIAEGPAAVASEFSNAFWGDVK